MGVLRLQPPAEYPVSIEDVCDSLRLEDDEGDRFIERLIAAATRTVEQKTQRALVSQKWEFIIDGFPGSANCDGTFLKKNSAIISLPLPPLISVESIKYIDVNGVEQTISPADYVANFSSFLGGVYPAYGKAWPSARNQPQAVRIAFTAGYGDAADVEPDLSLAIALLVGHYNENREASSDRQVYEIPLGVDRLIAPYIVPSAP